MYGKFLQTYLEATLDEQRTRESGRSVDSAFRPGEVVDVSKYVDGGPKGLSVGNPRLYPGMPQLAAGQGSRIPRPIQPPRGGEADRRPKAGNCPTDPTAPNWGGICVCGPGECEYDPAVFCGWSVLPFSTFKDQGDAPELDGPVLASFASERTVRITAERACLFRIRGWWATSRDSNDCSSLGLSLLANVRINDVPRVIEVGSSAPAERIGVPTALFDNTFIVLPADFGILTAINNNSRPMELVWTTPCEVDQNVVGVLFGDPITDTGEAFHGNYMLA